MRTKTLYRCDAQKIDISRFPNFHITGSITGMKKLYYGKNALLVRCGSWIYNVSSERMQMLRPVLLNNSTTFEVVVDNEFAAKDFTALIPELQDYLRGRLKNSKVMMTVRVSEATETVRPVGRVEKFQMMAQKNQALMQLKDEFGLELY